MDAFEVLNSHLAPEASMDDVRWTLHHLESSSSLPELRSVFNTLKSVAQAVLRPDDTRSPFHVGLDLRPDGQVRHGSYSDEEKRWLRQAVAHVTHPGLRARLADRLWFEVKHDASLALQAIRDYQAYAALRDTPELINGDPRDATDSLRRAVSLIRQSGNKKVLLEPALKVLEDSLVRHQSDDALGRYSSPLLQVMYQVKRGDPAQWAARATELAQECEAQARWAVARRHWDTAALFEARAGRSGAAQKARLAAAETVIQEARESRQPAIAPFLTIRRLERGVELLRSAGAEPSRVEALLRDIRALQIDSDAFLKAVGYEVPPALVKQQRQLGQAQVSGLTVPGALQQLASLATIPPLAELETRAQRSLQGSVVQHIATQILTDQAGRQQAILNGEEEYLAYYISQEAESARLEAVIALDAAVAQLHKEHSLALDDLVYIVRNNARIPPGHEASVHRGLWAGLMGDLLIAVPVLLPQLEASLRHILTTRDVVTSGLDPSGTQQEQNLNAFLADEKYAAVLRDDLGQTFVNDLRTLLVDKLGPNLRNTAAHGLALDAQLQDVSARYAWALILRFFLGGLERRSAAPSLFESPQV